MLPGPTYGAGGFPPQEVILFKVGSKHLCVVWGQEIATVAYSAFHALWLV